MWAFLSMVISKIHDTFQNMNLSLGPYFYKVFYLVSALFNYDTAFGGSEGGLTVS